VRYLDFFHVYRASFSASVLKIVVVAANSFKDSGITIKDDAGGKPDVKSTDIYGEQ